MTDPTATGLVFATTAWPDPEVAEEFRRHGDEWEGFSSEPCLRAVLTNPSAVEIEARQEGVPGTITVSAGGRADFDDVTDTQKISVRRLDQGNDPIAVTARWER